ncbi:hypothetical protein EB73_03435 [Mycobacterium sp. SWH-M3]|nr:hypothetical protein EB73_03435 [Mycobacterium sp. SWH-M3]
MSLGGHGVPSIVTLCGSMRFFGQMLAVAADLTARGHIVLAPFPVDESSADARTDELAALHRRKIDMADRVVVVSDESGYIGEATRGEITYAQARGVSIEYRAVSVNAAQHGANDADAAGRSLRWMGLSVDDAARIAPLMRLTQPQPVRVPLAGRRPGEDFLGPDGKPTRLNEVLTEEDFDRVKAAPTPAVFFDEVAALMYPARVYGDWLLALGLPDLAEKARTQLATTTTAATALVRDGRASLDRVTIIPTSATHPDNRERPS